MYIYRVDSFLYCAFYEEARETQSNVDWHRLMIFFRAARCERASVWLETLTGDPKYQLQNPIDRCNFGKEPQKI